MEYIKKYFTNLTEVQETQFLALGVLYQNWNEKINVISRQDINNLYLHHVLHSLAIAEVIKFAAGNDILDVGTGGGFPGLPLAIMFPNANFLLVDSIGKKLKVVDAIAQEIGLKNLKTWHGRAEEVQKQFDFVVSRAVTRLDVMWQWVEPTLKTPSKNLLPNGLLYLKGGDISLELPAKVNYRRWELNLFFDETNFDQKALVLLSRLNDNKD